MPGRREWFSILGFASLRVLLAAVLFDHVFELYGHDSCPFKCRTGKGLVNVESTRNEHVDCNSDVILQLCEIDVTVKKYRTAGTYSLRTSDDMAGIKRHRVVVRKATKARVTGVRLKPEQIQLSSGVEHF